MDMCYKEELRKQCHCLMAALCMVAFASLLSSCATPKNTGMYAQADYSGAFQQIQARIDSLTYDLRRVRKRESVKSSAIDVNNETTFFSRPDSMGRQYATAVSKTTVGKEENEREIVETETAVSIRKILDEVSALREQLDAAISKKEDTESLSRWDLHKDKVYAGAILLIIAYMLYLRLKKGG